MKMKGAILFLSFFLYLPGVSLMAQTGAELLPNATVSQDTSAPPPEFVPVEKEPRILKQAIPVYPEEALKDGIEGRIILKMWVGEDGKPHQVVILKRFLKAGNATLQIEGQGAHGQIGNRNISVPATIFDQPTIDAAMQYRFTPAILNNKPVAIWVVIPFSYQLKPDSAHVPKYPRSGPAPTKAQELETVGLKVAAKQPSGAASDLASAISWYNEAMHHERVKEYQKAVTDYRRFLREAEKAKINAEEMVRYAKMKVEELSRSSGKSK